MRKGENLRTLSAKEAADIAALSPGVTRGLRGEVVTVFRGANATALFEVPGDDTMLILDGRTYLWPRVTNA